MPGYSSGQSRVSPVRQPQPGAGTGEAQTRRRLTRQELANLPAIQRYRVEWMQVLVPEGEPSNPGRPVHDREAETRNLDSWAAFARAICEGAQKAAKQVMVVRARRIWGRLGNTLKRSKWAIEYREEYLIPSVIQRWVKVWTLK